MIKFQKTKHSYTTIGGSKDFELFQTFQEQKEAATFYVLHTEFFALKEQPTKRASATWLTHSANGTVVAKSYPMQATKAPRDVKGQTIGVVSRDPNSNHHQLSCPVPVLFDQKCHTHLPVSTVYEGKYRRGFVAFLSPDINSTPVWFCTYTVRQIIHFFTLCLLRLFKNFIIEKTTYGMLAWLLWCLLDYTLQFHFQFFYHYLPCKPNLGLQEQILGSLLPASRERWRNLPTPGINLVQITKWRKYHFLKLALFVSKLLKIRVELPFVALWCLLGRSNGCTSIGTQFDSLKFRVYICFLPFFRQFVLQTQQ